MPGLVGHPQVQGPLRVLSCDDKSLHSKTYHFVLSDFQLVGFQSTAPLKKPVVAFTLIQVRCERWPNADGSCRIQIVPDHADRTVATIVLGAEKKSADEWWAALLARQEQREQPIVFDQGVYLRQRSRRGRNASWRLRFFRLDLQSQALHYFALHTATDAQKKGTVDLRKSVASMGQDGLTIYIRQPTTRMELAAALLTDSLPLAHAWRLALTLAAEGFVEREGATLEEAVTARFEAEHSQRLLGAVAEVANSRVILTSWVRVGMGADKSTDRPYFLQPETGETTWELVTPPPPPSHLHDQPDWLYDRTSYTGLWCGSGT